MFMVYLSAAVICINVLLATLTQDKDKETNYLLWAILASFPLYAGIYK